MTSIPQRSLGGTAKDIQVGNIGYGLMFLTVAQNPPSDEEAFASMKAAVEAGATFWNSGSFYGPPDDPLANLKLLRRFFDKYPEYSEPGKIFLSVKGYFPGTHNLDAVRKDLERIVETLGPRKRIDLFELARATTPVETSIPALKALIAEGFFNHIGMSEVSAATLRKAHTIHPITAVEVEASLWAMENELHAVIKTSEELGISVIGYSPLGRGFLRFKSRDDIPEGDRRRTSPKFSEQNFPINMKISSALRDISARRTDSVSPSQLALSFLLHSSPNMIPIPGSNNIDRVLENVGAGNVKLSTKEYVELNKILDEFPSAGARYSEDIAKFNWL